MNERVFYKLLSIATPEDLEAQLSKERRFDPDLWVVERESRIGEHDLTVLLE